MQFDVRVRNIERPGHHRPRRLSDWINPTGDRKVHSLVDKVYSRTNLALAWEKVRRNKGAGGVDGEELEQFEACLEENLDRLHQQLKDGTYEPKPVLRHRIPKAGQPGKHRDLGIPTINGALCFDERYLGNPLVYCGTVGMLPRDKSHKQPQAGDHIVAIGGRTGQM